MMKLFMPMALALLLLPVSPAALALGPDELLLVVNRNVPAGRKLAEFYTTARQVPEGRIVALDLPTGDDIPFALYEKNVVRPLREHLRAGGLEEKIRCFVTFYGVPLRIGPRMTSDMEKREIAGLTREKDRLLAELSAAVGELEASVALDDPSFTAGAGSEQRELIARAESAIKRLRTAMVAAAPDERPARMADLVETLRRLFGPAGVLRAMLPADNAAPPAGEQVERLVASVGQLAAQIDALQQHRDDPDARAKVRALVAGGFGLIEHLRIVEAHLAYLDAAESMAALDSELAMLWWNLYPRARWTGNPLFHGAVGSPTQPALMVSRLDAPQSGQVREMILASLKAERDGLQGKIVLDARGLGGGKGGLATVGSYEWYDQSIMSLSELLRAKAKTPMLLDVSPTVLPAGSAGDVAIYCGWYSVRNYVPACRFAVGAVAFHVASFELVNLRNPEEKGWVRGLLNDGAVASLGPVAEPYLMAFPKADEFFPLLMTGRLTLAECYWRTQPTVSWMMALIGDPLYRPYAKNPVLRGEDLPEKLARLLKPES